MSAYGNIARPSSNSSASAAPLLYRLPDDSQNLAVVPLKADSIPNELVSHLAEIFNAIVREGRTYPQENELSLQGFKDYFCAYDLFVGLLVPNELASTGSVVTTLSPTFFEDLQKQVQAGVLRWTAICAGCYYIKPNYPGRSSHCCNAGFIVNPNHRGRNEGFTAVTEELLGYRLGYKYSVFNLVYVNNIASIKIWDSLGFQRTGLIPKAGRLKTVDGKLEEYVDAIVYWRDFAMPLERG